MSKVKYNLHQPSKYFSKVESNVRVSNIRRKAKAKQEVVSNSVIDRLRLESLELKFNQSHVAA